MQKVKEILERELGVTPRTVGNSLKATIPYLKNGDVVMLNDIYMSDSLGIEEIEIKRSGKGLTVILTFEELL